MSWKAIQTEIAQLSGTEYVILRNARVPSCFLDKPGQPIDPDGLSTADITILNGQISDAPLDVERRSRSVDMAGRMVLPGMVDCHTHIDKGQVWARNPNPDGSFPGAIEAAIRDGVTYTAADDVRARADFCLMSAYAHGTVALRTHVDVLPEIFDSKMGVLRELSEDWAGRIDVQLCPFSGLTESPDWLARVAKLANTPHSGILSLFLQAGPDLIGFVDDAMHQAERFGLALDFHADDTLDPNSACLAEVARAILRNRYEGPVLVGHCCALSVQDELTMRKTLDLVAQTQIGIVSLPLCNMYLQDRHPAKSPRLRGFAPLHEIRARGIPVAIASDNTRDPFYAYGDLDMIEVFRDAMRMMQLDHPVADWPATITSTAAKLIGRDDLGQLTAGSPADLILLPARNWSEFAARPASDRIVLRTGQPIETTPPDFSDLDGLEGMTP